MPAGTADFLEAGWFRGRWFLFISSAMPKFHPWGKFEMKR
jgi:hypothetical protein